MATKSEPGAVATWSVPGCSESWVDEYEPGAVATWSVIIRNELIATGPGRYRSWFCICLALQFASC
jgi:hypothetical protein